MLILLEFVDLPIELNSVYKQFASVLEERNAMLRAIEGHIV